MRRIRLTSSAPFVYIRRKKRRKVSAGGGTVQENLYRRKICVILIQDQERRRTGEARFGGFLCLCVRRKDKMIGVIVNVLAVALGGVLGTVFSKKLSTRFTTELNKVFGVCAIGMGISSVPLMQNMPAVILAVVAGTALGLACHLGEWISRGGELMEKPIGKLLGERNGDDEDGLPREEYLSLLVTAIVLFCSSGTGIYGCLDAGMTGNATVLLSKSILDFFTAMVFACNLGAVTSLVAVPQAAVFFALFFAAKAIYPLTTSTMIGDFKACGGFLLIATGCRIAKMQEFPVADMIPAMMLVMPLSALWTNYIAPLL